MAVQHAGCPREERGQHENHELVAGNINADRFGGDAVIPDGHNGAALLGALEVHHDKNGEQHQYDSVGQELFCIGIDGVGIEAQSAAGEIKIGDDVLDDLAASQGDNGKIVAPEPQGGQTDRKAKERRYQAANDHGKRQADRHGEDIHQGDGQKAAGEKPDRHEPSVAQGEFPQKADNEIERDRQHDVDRNGDDHIGELAGETAAIQQVGDHSVNRCDQDEGQKIAGKFEFFLFHLLTPSHSLFYPRGRWA